MLWMLVLPTQITFLLLVVVVFFTARAPAYKWNQNKTFLISSLLATLAFIPSCTGIMFLVDGFRFGNFEFETFADIKDPRTKSYLPPAASMINIHLQASDSRARYRISGEQLDEYLDQLWENGSHSSLTAREELRGTYLEEEMRERFSDLGWEPLPGAICHRSPTQADGGGAIYYFDRDAGVVYQHTTYW